MDQFKERPILLVKTNADNNLLTKEKNKRERLNLHLVFSLMSAREVLLQMRVFLYSALVSNIH